MKAVGYTRVSTDEQTKSGVSLPAQRQQIKAFCHARHWQLVEIFADEGMSGKAMKNRPGLQSALIMLDEGGAQALVVTKLDRLSRSVLDTYALVEGRFTSNGLVLASVGESLDTSTPQGKGFLGFLAVFAQMEREMIVERTRTALSHVRSQGKYLGACAFGKKRDADGRLVADPDAVRGLRKARRLRREGKSWREVSAAMGWSISQSRTRLDPGYRAQAWSRKLGQR